MGQAFRAAAPERVRYKKERGRVWKQGELRHKMRRLTERVRIAGTRLEEQLTGAGMRLRPWMRGTGLTVLCTAAAAVSLPGQIVPFGLALCIAVPQQAAFLCSVGCALGSFLGLPPVLAVGQAAGALLIGALRLVLGRKNDIWAGLAGVAVCSMLSQTVSLLGQPQAGPLRWAVQSLLVLGLALLYRELRPGEWLGMSPRCQLVRLAVWTSLLCGLAALPGPEEVPLVFLAASGMAGLLLCALEQTHRLPLWWTAGALACLCMRQDAGLLAVSAAAVWLAGRMNGRRSGMAAVFAAAGLLNLFAADTAAAFLWLAVLYAAAGLAFGLLPARLLFALEEKLTASGETDTRTPARTLQALACGLEAIGNGMETVGRAAAPSADDPNAPVETVCRQVCSSCVQKARCWGAEYDDTQTAMQSLLESWRQDCGGEFPPWFGCTRQGTVRTALLRAENLRVLRRANQAENGVLRRAVSEQYRAVAEGLNRMAAAWQPETPQPQLESRLHALANALQLPVRELQAVRRADGLPEVRLLLRPVRLGESVTDALEYSVSRCCGVPMAMTANDAAEGKELRFLPRPRYALHIGTAAKARDRVCGDVTEQLQTGPVRYLLLCDGMGTGVSAAMDAKMAALFTARLLRAGFACDVAARLVNAALLTRAPGDRGSTLDVLRFDGMDGSAVFYKAGACAAYLLREGAVRRLGADAAAADSAANGLPLGSAGTVKDARLELSLQPGDRLVMVSDGMLTGGEERLLRAVKALTPAPPQAMAQALLAAVGGERPEDDCTAAVLCVEHVSQKSPENVC